MAPRGLGFTSICLQLTACFFVLSLHKKVPGYHKSFRAVLTYARSYVQKRFLTPQWGFGNDDTVLYINTKT
jgi:hypothetical protein